MTINFLLHGELQYQEMNNRASPIVNQLKKMVHSQLNQFFLPLCTEQLTDGAGMVVHLLLLNCSMAVDISHYKVLQSIRQQCFVLVQRLTPILFQRDIRRRLRLLSIRLHVLLLLLLLSVVHPKLEAGKNVIQNYLTQKCLCN